MCAIIRKRPKAEKPQKSIEERKEGDKSETGGGSSKREFSQHISFSHAPRALALSILLPQMTPEWQISQAYKAWE